MYLLGNGARGAAELLPALLDLGQPVLTSWQAADLVDNHHPNYFGRPGIYGQRCANKVLVNANYVIAIGNRMSLWNVGDEPLPARILYCDLDPSEAKRLPNAVWAEEDAYDFIEDEIRHPRPVNEAWLEQCSRWRSAHPWLEPKTHEDRDGFIDAYAFTKRLEPFLSRDEVIVTDMGTALCTAHQVLKLKPPQRLMTSGGLGEMGCALPAAIGAAFATGKPVLCLTCDGGMMLNLQELQTIVHHNLPVKIIVYSNDGYLMLKHTQRGAGMKYSGVDAKSGVSCPSFRKLAYALDIPASEIRTWDEFAKAIPQLFAAKGPALVEFFMHPEQPLVPKISYAMVDGQKHFDRFDEMSPKVAHG